MTMETDPASVSGDRVAATAPTVRTGESSWRHLPLTLTTLAVMLLAVWHREGNPAYPGHALLALAVLQWLPLLFRTVWPVPVLASTAACSAAQLLLIPQLKPDWESAVAMAVYQPVPVAVMVAAFTVGLRTPRRTAWVAGGTAAFALPAIALAVQPATEYLWTNLVMCNLILDGTAIGVLVAGRRERLVREAQEREEQTRRAVEDERFRIARELHDVLAHHLTLVNAQASVAEYLVRSDPDAAATALEGLTTHTRQALDEVRATVGLLREPTHDDAHASAGRAPSSVSTPASTRTTDGTAAPLPTLDQLPQLLSNFRAAGTTIHAEISGVRQPLSPRGELAAYRLLQEALTNATKHAPGAPVTVTLEWGTHQLRIRVHNTAPAGASPAGHAAHHGGYGLVGMAERVKAAGGTLDLPRPEGGGFTVTATLPTDAAGATPFPLPHDPMETP